MGKRKITVLENVILTVSEISFLLKEKEWVTRLIKFVDDVFDCFERLSNDTVKYRLCSYQKWKDLGYTCVSYKRKYVVAFLDMSNEVIVCDFMPSKLLRG